MMLFIKEHKLYTYFFSLYIFFSFFTPTTFDYLKVGLLLSFFYFALKVNVFITKNTLVILSLLIIYHIFALIKGVISYGESSYGDGKIYVIYYSIYAFTIILFTNRIQLHLLHQAVIFSSVFLSLYFYFCLFSELDFLPFSNYDFLQQEFMIAIGVGKVKIYGLNLISYTFILPFIIVDSYYKYIRKLFTLKTLLILLLNLSAIIIILRRGIVLSTIVSVIFVLVILNKNKLRIIVTSFVGISLVILTTSVALKYTSYGTSAEGFREEILSAFDFKTNKSNSIRVEQARYLLDGALEKPILGNGFGAHFNNYYRSETSKNQFELQYLKMFYNIGALGAILAFSFFMFIMTKSIKICKVDNSFKYYLAPALTGFLSAIIANGFNPILTQLSSLIMLFFPLYIINIFEYENR